MADERSDVTRYRIERLERDSDRVRDVPGRVTAVEENMAKLEAAISRLTWSIVGFAFTVAASTAGAVILIVLRSG